jgi:hypothetical protein
LPNRGSTASPPHNPAREKHPPLQYSILCRNDYSSVDAYILVVSSVSSSSFRSGSSTAIASELRELPGRAEAHCSTGLIFSGLYRSSGKTTANACFSDFGVLTLSRREPMNRSIFSILIISWVAIFCSYIGVLDVVGQRPPEPGERPERPPARPPHHRPPPKHQDHRNTSSPEPTATPPSTLKPTPTPTPSPTATASSTPAATPTATPSPTPHSTATPSATAKPASKS